MSTEITIKVKQTTNNTFIDLQTSLETTVLALKIKIQELTKINPEQQTLIYKGKILVDDKTISDYSLQDSNTVILVKKEKDENNSFNLKSVVWNGSLHINSSEPYIKSFHRWVKPFWWTNS